MPFALLVLLAYSYDGGVTPPLIPREVLFARSERVSPKLSPDGRRIAWLAPDAQGTARQLWLQTLGTSQEIPLTFEIARTVRRFEFTQDSQGLLVEAAPAQDATPEVSDDEHVFFIDLVGRTARDLTPAPGTQAELIAPSTRVADTAIIATNQRDHTVMDAWRVNVKSGAASLDTKNPGDVKTWFVDGDFVIRAAIASTFNGGTELRVRDAAKTPWRAFITTGPEETLELYDFTADNRSLLLRTTISGDTSRIVEKHLRSGTERVLAQNEKSEPLAVLVNRNKHVVQAAAFEVNGRREWKSLDYTITADLERLSRATPGDASVVSVDTAEQKWLVQIDEDTASTKFGVFDRRSNTLSVLFTAAPRIDSAPLATTTPVTMPARDGALLNGFFTAHTTGTSRKMGLVVIAPVAAFSRDVFGFRPDVQLYANRGYAVLQVNARGLLGAGKRFSQAVLSMHDDVLDAVKWAVAERLVDPKRIALVGAASFEENTVFACVVDTRPSRENRLDMYARAEAELSKCLNGRAEAPQPGAAR